MSNYSFKADLSKGKARLRVEKTMKALSITEYGFIDGNLVIPKNASFILPTSLDQLPQNQRSIIANMVNT